MCVCRFTEEASGEMNLGQVKGVGQAEEELARVRLQPWPEERLPLQSCPAWPGHRASSASHISAKGTRSFLGVRVQSHQWQLLSHGPFPSSGRCPPT